MKVVSLFPLYLSLQKCQLTVKLYIIRQSGVDWLSHLADQLSAWNLCKSIYSYTWAINPY